MQQTHTYFYNASTKDSNFCIYMLLFLAGTLLAVHEAQALMMLIEFQVLLRNPFVFRLLSMMV